jgi:hypothetical protein
MAIDTAADRAAALNFGLPMSVVLPIPDDNDLEAEQRAHSVSLYAGFALDEGEEVEGGDVAIFLDDATAVPAGAVRIHGAAYHADGRRYVALWPSNNAVSYISHWAHRQDGALIIVATGTVNVRHEGVSLTDRGESLYSNDPATHFVAGQFFGGWRLNQDGAICFSGP